MGSAPSSYALHAVVSSCVQMPNLKRCCSCSQPTANHERRTAVNGHGSTGAERALRGMLETFGRYRQLAKIFLVQAAGLGVAFEHKRMEI
jgi:hypothetical protein